MLRSMFNFEWPDNEQIQTANDNNDIENSKKIKKKNNFHLNAKVISATTLTNVSSKLIFYFINIRQS
jgi:hypothetical protein